MIPLVGLVFGLLFLGLGVWLLVRSRPDSADADATDTTDTTGTPGTSHKADASA